MLTLVHAMVAGASHIDHADVLRSGDSEAVLGHRVMAPSTLGTFLRSFSFGHVRQLETVIGVTIERAWTAGAGPDAKRLVVDIDSTICDVAGKAKQGAAYGYTKVLGYHPLWRFPHKGCYVATGIMWCGRLGLRVCADGAPSWAGEVDIIGG